MCLKGIVLNDNADCKKTQQQQIVACQNTPSFYSQQANSLQLPFHKALK